MHIDLCYVIGNEKLATCQILGPHFVRQTAYHYYLLPIPLDSDAGDGVGVVKECLFKFKKAGVEL